MSGQSQSFENHAKIVPMFHGVTFLFVLIAVGGAGFWLVRDFSAERVVAMAGALGLLLTMFWARLFALGAQDRVIRLEERLRMERVLPDDLKPRIDEVSTDLLIGLRFAPDDELADLTRRALDGELADRKAVKQAIKDWRADHQRL